MALVELDGEVLAFHVLLLEERDGVRILTRALEFKNLSLLSSS